MPDPNMFRLNRVPFSWTSCAHFFSGLPYKGITACSFEESREVKIVGAGQQDGTPLGITSGIYKLGDVSFTLLRDSAHALLLDLTILGLGSYGDAEFTYLLQLFEPISPINGVPSLPTNTLLSGLRITKVAEKQEYGSDELVTEITCSGLYCVRSIGGVPLQLWSKIRTLLP